MCIKIITFTKKLQLYVSSSLYHLNQSHLKIKAVDLIYETYCFNMILCNFNLTTQYAHNMIFIFYLKTAMRYCYLLA